MDWNKYKVRCSSLFVLFVDPQKKEDKKKGLLSETAKKHFYQVYLREKWGRWKDITAKQLDKGKQVEDQLIETIAILDGEKYVKNTERKSNDWIEGECDVVGNEHIDDVKGAWDADSFAPHIMEDIPNENWYQSQGYMWLWGKKKAKISRILVSCPPPILKKELQKLLYSMDVASDQADEYKIAAAELVHNLTYEDVPIDERIIRKEVLWDQSVIDQIPAKVTAARKFLSDMEAQHKAYSFLKEEEPPPFTVDIASIPLLKIKK